MAYTKSTANATRGEFAQGRKKRHRRRFRCCGWQIDSYLREVQICKKGGWRKFRKRIVLDAIVFVRFSQGLPTGGNTSQGCGQRSKHQWPRKLPKERGDFTWRQ